MASTVAPCSQCSGATDDFFLLDGCFLCLEQALTLAFCRRATRASPVGPVLYTLSIWFFSFWMRRLVSSAENSIKANDHTNLLLRSRQWSPEGALRNIAKEQLLDWRPCAIRRRLHLHHGPDLRVTAKGADALVNPSKRLWLVLELSIEVAIRWIHEFWCRKEVKGIEVVVHGHNNDVRWIQLSNGQFWGLPWT